MSKETKYNRRHFLSTAFMSFGAAELSMIGLESKQFINQDFGHTSLSKPGINKSFDQLKQIDAGVLNVGYAEDGPAGGPAVILLHGWPYDIYSFADVTPILVAKGYRVIVPYLRGYGTTRFLSDHTFRNGQQSAIASDIIALMDALSIGKAIVAGFDWGARTANIIAAIWPE